MDLEGQAANETVPTQELEPGRMLQRARAMAQRLDAMLVAARVRPSAATADAHKDGASALAMAALAVRSAEAAEALAADADLPQLQTAFARYFASQPGRPFMQRVARSALQRATVAAVTCRGYGEGAESPSSPEDLSLATALATAQRTAAAAAACDAETGEEPDGADRWANALSAAVHCRSVLQDARRTLPLAERDASVALFAAGWRRPARCLGPSTVQAVQVTLDRVEALLEATVQGARAAARTVVMEVEAAARPRAWALYAAWRPALDTSPANAPSADDAPQVQCALEEKVVLTPTSATAPQEKECVDFIEAEVFCGAGDSALMPVLEWPGQTTPPRLSTVSEQTREIRYSLRRRSPTQLRFSCVDLRPRRSISRKDRRRTTVALRNALKNPKNWSSLGRHTVTTDDCNKRS